MNSNEGNGICAISLLLQQKNLLYHSYLFSQRAEIMFLIENFCMLKIYVAPIKMINVHEVRKKKACLLSDVLCPSKFITFDFLAPDRSSYSKT